MNVILHTYNMVSYGVGVNSTAMIIGMFLQGIPIDLILFADTGSEMPETYAYLPIMNKWLKRHGLPEIITVEKYTRDGYRQSLEDELIHYSFLPSLAYGWRKCSIKHKIAVQDKFCNHLAECQEVWANGEKVNRFIGYDAKEAPRIARSVGYHIVNPKYDFFYPLYDWGWDRDYCKHIIQENGLPVPQKSSCYFCPGMKKHEIQNLWEKHPDLFQKAISIETNGLKTARTVKGLGRSYSWKEYYEATINAEKQVQKAA